MSTFASKIVILAVSDNHKDYKIPILEFCKRLTKSTTLITLKPTRGDVHHIIIQKETDLIISKLGSYHDYTKILLSKDGSQYTSEQFASMISQGKRCFIIGGPYGLDETRLTSYIAKKLSLGTHTMPHGLALLTILEQIYRAACIIEGKQYHY